ncbi:MAG: cyclic nucleotide-binding domain-containing protein, partial [Pseudomonadota bacterium]
MHTSHSTPSDEDHAPSRQVLNRLLSSLPEDDQHTLLALCDTVRIEVGDVLYEPGQTIRHIYFPVDSLISLLAVAEGRMTLEVGSVGQEGMIGASVALGHEQAQVRAVVQRAGRASRIAAADFCTEFRRTASLQRLLYRYTDTLLAQAIQIAVC